MFRLNIHWRLYTEDSSTISFGPLLTPNHMADIANSIITLMLISWRMNEISHEIRKGCANSNNRLL